MRKSMQLKAMNVALFNHACKSCKDQNLSTAKTNTIKQTAHYNEPYNNVEVYKSSKIYKTLIATANKTIDTIEEVKTED